MIVCSCNVLSDHDVRGVLADGKASPRKTRQVYGCLGCNAQCGRCVRTIRRIMDEALVAACSERCDCCPDGRHQA
jgi:bacterioferritin-associated ferredoxin